MQLPISLIDIIYEYLPRETPYYDYKLVDWFDEKQIDWSELSENPNAIHLLEQNIDKIDWDWLSGNPEIFKPIYK